MPSVNGRSAVPGGSAARSTSGSSHRSTGSLRRVVAPRREGADDPRPSAPDDASVVALVLAGDTAAYAELVRRHQDALYRLATGMLRDPDLAADVVQDAFVKAYSALPHCHTPHRFGAWIYRILLNRCRDFLKRRKRNMVPLDEAAVAAPERECPSAGVGRADLRAAVERALATLPDSQREAFLLRHVEDRPYEEIAGMLGTSVGAVKMRVMRAREALQEQLQDWRP